MIADIQDCESSKKCGDLQVSLFIPKLGSRCTIAKFELRRSDNTRKFSIFLTEEDNI